MKALHTPRVKLEVESLRRIKLAQAMEARAATNASGAKENLGLHLTRRSHWARSC